MKFMPFRNRPPFKWLKTLEAVLNKLIRELFLFIHLCGKSLMPKVHHPKPNLQDLADGQSFFLIKALNR